MSISVRGTLVVQRKRGRKGEFNVGDLSTEIGEFEVKDALIEEYEPGRYAGEFVIKWIEPDSFSWRGRVFVKNRASLDAIFIDEADESEGAATPALPPEPDPADSAPATDGDAHDAHDKRSAPSSAKPPRPAPAASARSGASGVDDDPALFGAELFELLAAHQPMKLDPTIDRVQFRQQRDRLKALGYAFNVKNQTWSCEPQG
jgi:hypothetical protein